MMYNIWFVDEEGKRERKFTFESADEALAKMRYIREELNKLGCVLDRDIYPSQTIIRFTCDNKGACYYELGMNKKN